MSSQDQTVLILGADGLIGSAIADHLSNVPNLKLIAADIAPRDGLRRIKDLVETKNVLYAPLNITVTSDYSNLFEMLNQKNLKIDSMINCSYPRNQNYGRKLEDVEFSDFCENVNLHLGGYFLAMKELGFYFKQRGGGHVISLSSIYGVLAPRFEVYPEKMTMPVEYAAIKSALIHLTKYFTKYFKDTAVRFNCVSPGGFFDQQNPQFVENYNSLTMGQGLLAPRDICGLIQFLISDGSKFINGQNIIIDDGWTL